MALNFGKLNFSTAFNPTSAFPLDARSYFESLELAQQAAATAEEVGSSNTTYYIGETIVVYDDSAATLYIIQPDKTLKEVGSVPLGDNLSIQIVDGKVQLNGFNDHYYAYSEGESGEAIYTLTSGFIAGLEPKVRENESGQLELAWYEPNPTTVEGLSSQINTINEKLATIESGAEVNLIDIVKVNNAALPISEKAVNIDLTPYALKTDITSVFKFKGTKATQGELPPSDNAVGDVWYVTENDTEYVWTGTEWEEFGPAIDLSDYATTEQLESAVSGINTTVSGILTKLDTVESGANVNVIDAVSSEFTIDESGKVLNVKEIASSKITGLGTLATKSTIDLTTDVNESGQTLITKLQGLADITSVGSGLKLESGVLTNAYTVETATQDTLGVVKGTSAENGISINESGEMAVNNVNVNKLTQTTGEMFILDGGTASGAPQE